MSGDNDIRELIALCGLKNRAAFVQLYHQTSAKLFGVVLRILKNRSDAEDALQEVYVKIWNNADKFAGDHYSPMSWLIVVARNHAIDIIRARKPGSADIDEVPDLSDDRKTPEEEVINASEGERINNCLSELDQQKADAVRGAYVEGYSYEELAERYSVPLNTMRTWLRRSLISLRKCLER